MEYTKEQLDWDNPMFLLKKEKEIKSLKTVHFLKETRKTIKEKEKKFVNIQMGLFMKASF